VTAASVTGPVNDAAAAAILADGSLVAPRALNAFEVGVVGLLDVVPAAAGGVPDVLAAVERVRRDTFDAMHAPIVPNPTPTAEPHGPVQVAVVSVIDVGAAVAFPAFNDVLGATTAVPDAAARELAATGDPARAVAAGVTTAGEAGQAAVTVVSHAVRTAIDDVRASRHSPRSRAAAEDPVATSGKDSKPSARAERRHPLRDAISKVRKAIRHAASDGRTEKPSESSDDHS
jgi:hypothetical protein